MLPSDETLSAGRPKLSRPSPVAGALYTVNVSQPASRSVISRRPADSLQY